MEPEPPEREFVDLLERHQAILHRVTRLYAQNAEDRRDLFQEISYQLWRSWPRFRREASVTTWMYRIALNTALTGLRRSHGVPVTSRLDIDHPAPPAPEDPVEQRERIRSLHEAIRTFEPADRAVVMLHLEDFAHREIAEMLGISENLVNVKLHRIRGRLRATMKDAFDGD